MLPDSLSHRPDLCIASTPKETSLFDPPASVPVNNTTHVNVIEQLATGNLEDVIIEAQLMCPEFPRLKRIAIYNLDHKTFSMSNNVILINKLIWVPTSQRPKFLFEFHDDVLVGHP